MTAFNNALLSKQCWRILTTDDSLVSRVLKGKYFPRSNFWEAATKGRCNYTWRSLMSAKVLLDRGARKIIGNGVDTRLCAYYVQVEEMASQGETSAGHNKLWGRLWKTHAPPKIRNFMWRLCKKAVPVMVILAKRGVVGDPRCPRCGEETETIEHTVLRCHEAAKLWKISPLRIDVSNEQIHDFRWWIEDRWSITNDDTWWALFMCISWEIWKAWNKWVFEHVQTDHIVSVSRAMRLSEEYKEANTINCFLSTSIISPKR
ncbi:hypothetical protein RND81_02G121000 [Saponaria officinalis]|uniref:Reverse transcriptase zinc-binding domain-containing protein n=1 Tax=Saponaria officinalis TaxID=3572 RepID=A0AAW1MSY0_SAPOF